MILPAGKSNNSFIPFDVKLENNLPTYKEKDAVYTYHFYQTYYNVLKQPISCIILNTEIDASTGGEKSRFITQLEVEGYSQYSTQMVVSAIVFTSVEKRIQTNSEKHQKV